jgi:hypothetical protein
LSYFVVRGILNSKLLPAFVFNNEPSMPPTLRFSIGGGHMGPWRNVSLEGIELACRIIGYGMDTIQDEFVVSVEDDPDWEILVKFIRK